MNEIVSIYLTEFGVLCEQIWTVLDCMLCRMRALVFRSSVFNCCENDPFSKFHIQMNNASRKTRSDLHLPTILRDMDLDIHTHLLSGA